MLEWMGRIFILKNLRPVFVRGKELDREKTYTLSATQFIIDGGDGYDVLSKCKKTLEAENSLDCFKIIDEILNLPLELCYRTEFEIWKTVQTKFSDEFIRQAHQQANVNFLCLLLGSRR